MATSDSLKQVSVECQCDCETLSIPIQEDGSSSLSVDHSLDELCISLTIEEEKVPKQKRVLKIHRVPRILREKEARKKDKCYDPFVVSIGPYHHGKCELKDIESRKLRLARQYMKESGPPEQVRDKLAKVAKVASRLRECYAEEATKEFDDKTFTEMMLLDGCFIIQFLLDSTEGLDTRIVSFVMRDLFLLENQLPYQVLKELISLRFSESEANFLIEAFMHEVRGLDDPHESWIEKILKNFKAKPQQEKESNEPIHLLDLFRSCFINKCDLLGRNRPKKRVLMCSYPASKELKTMGIHFRPSKENNFTDIKFSSVLTAGFLKLPRIVLHDNTKSLLLNLVAYEASPDAPDEQVLTSYLYLMDTLIDQAQDVELLRGNRIIYNLLGSDQQAAELFNEIGEDLVLIDSGVFPDVKACLDRHYNNKCKTSTNEWLDRHFGSPWSVIALLLASFIIIVTFIQTYIASLTYCMSQDHPYFWCPFNSKTRL